MSKSENKLRKKKEKGLTGSQEIKAKVEDQDISNPSEIEQAMIEHRREADLDDKSPSGDAGVEDNKEEPQANDPIGESNY